MSVIKGLNIVAPQIGRRKRPRRHGAYVRSKRPLELRAKHVAELVNRALTQMPWIRSEHVPLLRQWSELECIRRACFAGLVHHGLFNVDNETRDVSVKRLVHDHRQLTLAQLSLQRELMMSPLAAAQVSGDGREQLDLVSLLAQQPEAAAEASDADSPLKSSNEPASDDE